MDSLITAAGRALAAGDPLGALNRVALRDDAPGLALRGIAMAQLGDLERARALLRQAARAFGPREEVARARCVVAEAEIALVSRDLAWPEPALERAGAVLADHGDRTNAAYARYLDNRRLLLIGDLAAAEAGVSQLDPALLPASARAAHELVAAGIAMRRIRAEAARQALARAADAAAHAGIPALHAEVAAAARTLEAPAARLVSRGEVKVLDLAAVETLLASETVVVDACRNAVRRNGTVARLDGRPVLFALARALAGAWPDDVSRADLVARAFRGREADESHRARLRVEIGRLRAALRGVADISATPGGFVLDPGREGAVVLLTPPVDEPHAEVLALLADGEAWSSSALALALGASQRTVQRALEALAAAGRARAFGRGRARRWLIPAVPGFPTTLLLPAPLPE